MRRHSRLPFVVIKMAVSVASVALVAAVTCPFAAAADATASATPSAAASDGASSSPTAMPDSSVTPDSSITPDGTESGSQSLVTPPDAADRTTPTSVTASPTAQPSPSRGAQDVRIAAVTSGVLRDATTGAPIRNSCLAYRPTSVTVTATNATTNVDDQGHWSFDSIDPGPFYIAFYVTANGDCSARVLTGTDDYRASWYQGQPFTGTDPGTALPPRGADQVTAGSNIVACLDTQNALPTECANPDTTISGRVVSFGPAPVFQACIVAIGANDREVGFAISDADGRWTMSGLPINFDYVVGVIPPFRTSEGPCTGTSGPPPAPPSGGLQPEFYDDTWADLSDPILDEFPFTWATDPNSPHPAVALRNSRTGIDVCLTTETGRATQRSSCDPATPTTAPTQSESNTDTGTALAATGGPSPLLPALGAAMVLAAVVIVARTQSAGRSSRSVRLPRM